MLLKVYKLPYDQVNYHPELTVMLKHLPQLPLSGRHPLLQGQVNLLPTQEHLCALNQVNPLPTQERLRALNQPATTLTNWTRMDTPLDAE
jgi:hypothetical protein